jgi:YcaO-like protein with predicted kinase domain
MPNQIRKYELALQYSSDGVAFYSALPAGDTDLTQALTVLAEAPNDEFMHRHALGLLERLDHEALETLIRETTAPPIRALLKEACLSRTDRSGLLELFAGDTDLHLHSPLITLRSNRHEDQDLHTRWTELFQKNIFLHEDLPEPGRTGLEAPAVTSRANNGPTAAELHARFVRAEPEPAIPLKETHAAAMDRLYGLGIVSGPEMRHEDSLSPFALLRQWRMGTRIRDGRHLFRLSGLMTSYGRGVTLAQARVTLAMEIVERYSSFMSVENGVVQGLRQRGELVRAARSQLRSRGAHHLDPGTLRLEAGYEDTELSWITGEDRHGTETLVPVQLAPLFLNLDEAALFSALGSTGLASGNSPEQARLSGLMEVLERDSEAVTPFRLADCFRITATSPEMRDLLDAYADQGIDPVFQDCTTEFGIPCFKCFAVLPDGTIAKGTGAHLSGTMALLSALTETPFPYPGGPASKPGPENLPVRSFEDLPDYTTGGFDSDLALTEAVLSGRGYEPLYVDLSRTDLRFPVVRAMVPGLELVADFDRFSRISPRLYRNYLNT